ncbi:hypothetical protein QR680_008865 [Steinernema hermaphroditum]|uniref:ShKT domain-containing protein n=1 Tax=Steinernema hermaphroditum TaxID=289476 RepID=A0AA39II66_9BILA|nr:hypothetical protein QR680_008865 [Steinernema hermaphroditum]
MLSDVTVTRVTVFAVAFASLFAQPFAHQNDLPYKVYRIFPRDWADVDKIAQLRRLEIEKQLDFWVDSNSPNQFADLMVPPFMVEQIEEFFERHKLQYNVSIPDVQKLIYRNEVDVKAKVRSRIDKKHWNASNSEVASFLRRLNDNVGFSSSEDSRVGQTRADYPFGDYASYKAMMKYMRTLEFYYPTITKLIRIGTTHEGRPIEGLKIGFPVNDTSKRALVAGYGNDPQITDYVDSLNFFIVPNLNPDGYEYTRESSRPEVRLWRKNRSPEQCVKSLWGGLRCCQGVDLNRNFDFHWSETGSTDNPCSNLYHGSNVFSEPEARAVKDFLTSPEMTDKVDAFITLHTYAQLWIHPFSHEIGQYTRDYHELHGLAVKAAKRLESVYGTHFKVGTGADLLSPAAGGSDDWAKGTMGIKYVYLLELRPELEVSRGFILHKSELIPTGVETLEAVKEVIRGVLKFNNIDVNLNRNRGLQRPTHDFQSRLPIVVQGVPNVVSQLKPTEQEGIVVNKVVFGGAKNREIVLISSNTSSAPVTTPSTTTTTEKTPPETTSTSTSTSTTTTTTTSTTTTSTTTSTTPTTTTTTTTTSTTQAPTTSTASQKNLVSSAPSQSSGSHSHERQKLSFGQRLSLQLIKKQMLRLRNLSPTPSATSPTTTPSSTPSTSTSTTTTTTTSPITTTSRRTTTPVAMPPLRAEASFEESAVTPKLEPAVVFQDERGPVSQSTINRSAPRFLTVSPNRPPASREVLLLPPLRSENPITGINEIVFKAVAPTTTAAPLSSAVEEFLKGENCKDMRYSCSFWIRSNRRVCEEQETYMRLQCAASCGYCKK